VEGRRRIADLLGMKNTTDRHADLRARYHAINVELAELDEANRRGELSDDQLEAASAPLAAERAEVVAQEEALAQELHGAQTALEAPATVRVRGINVAALERGYGTDASSVSDDLRTGRSWIEGPAAELADFAQGAIAMAEDNWENEAEVSAHEVSEAFFAHQRRQCLEATYRAAEAVLQALRG
jgi:hypothetical protein